MRNIYAKFRDLTSCQTWMPNTSVSSLLLELWQNNAS